MKQKTGLILFITLIAGVNAFSSEKTLRDTEKKSSGIVAFQVESCPADVTNNSISASATEICSGETITFTGTEPNVNPNQDSIFQWQSDASGSWEDITGATAINYTTGALGETTSFRRAVRFTDCNTDFVSNEILITVETVQPPAGNENQSFCSSGNPTVSDLAVTGSNISWYSDAEATISIPGTTVLVDGEIYYATQQNTNGCESPTLAVTAEVMAAPALSATGNNPGNCGEQGSIDFSFTDVPDGNYDILYDGGSFTNVPVSGNSATVSVDAGTYNNLTITVEECTSAPGVNATISDQDPPGPPAISVADNCGESVLTASNYTGSLLWSTGETSESITVTDAGQYSVTQTVNDCTSSAASVIVTPGTVVPTLTVTETDPIICQGNGSLYFTFTNVPPGIYSIQYDAGTFDGVTVLNNNAIVFTDAGTYNNLKITVDGCTSPDGVNAALNAPNAPDAPSISVEDLCGESVLTAANYDASANLEWSTGETGESITVTEAKTYSVTQELNGCTSDAATAMANPKPTPAAPGFSVTDNCDGTSTLTATGFDNSAQLEWSTGESTNTITVNAPGEYSLKQIIDGCQSNLVTKEVNPKTAPSINTTAINPENCGGQGSVDFVFTGVPDGNYDILYDGGSFEDVSVSNGTASVIADAGTYNNLKITVDGCTSPDGVNAALNAPNAPDAPSISVEDLCGESVLTAANYDASANLEWSTGETGESITVTEAKTYSVTQELNGCTSDAATAMANPKPTPAAPGFSVTDNCDGTSTLTATGFDNSAQLEWSTGESTNTITVNAPGEYSLKQIIDGCQSNLVTKEVNPKTAPSINTTAINPENCGELGTINFTFTNVPDGTYDIIYDNGSFTGITVSDNKATVKTTAGTYNNLKITLNECNTADGINAVLTEPDAPGTPIVNVENKCNESVLTVTGYDESATLLWNTGDTVPVLTVTEAGTYTVTQHFKGCTSNAAFAEATPKAPTGKPEVEIIDYCGESTIRINNLPTDTWFVWTYNNITDSTKNNSITVTGPGDYTVSQRIGECAGEDTTVSANPGQALSPPVSQGDVLICTDDPDIKITAEATVIGDNAAIAWYDAETGGNEVLSPVLGSPGTITYYAETQDPATGCKSLTRTPVTLTILQSAKTLILDSAIIGKPRQNVAVLIFPENLTSYQWYLNNKEITGATDQYYYIPESERRDENLFSVEVEISNGCKAKYSYSYSDILNSAVISGSNTLSIQENPSFKIYPNPANQQLYISLDASMIINEPELTARIFSANGTCVNEFKVTNPTESIDIRKLNPGMYSVVLYGGKGGFYTKKLIISH